MVGYGDAPGQAARNVNPYTWRKRGSSETDAMNNMLASLPARAKHLLPAGLLSVGAKPLGWLETGAAIAAVRTGGKVATRFVRRNPAVAVAAVAGAGLLYLAARHRAKKREAEEAADTRTRRVRARRAPRQPAAR